MSTIKVSILSVCVMALGFVACKKDNPDPTPDPTPSVSKIDSVEVQFSPAGTYTLYNFKDSTVIANADSATTKWDIGFKNVSIIVNSHSSGPGNAGAITQMVNATTTYDLATKAPESGYAYDTTAATPAISVDKTNGWYNYDIATHAFSPKADRFFFLKTADGHYVKFELLKVDYVAFNGPAPTTLKYKFRYTYQPDGSVNF